MALLPVGCTGGGGKADYAEVAFPQGFLWGTATAAHQVEGGNTNNDWYAWEQIPGKIKNGDVSGEASGHYTRYESDFALAAASGQNAHRFSIEWSRIEPQRDVYDYDEIGHYHMVLGSALAHGLTPIVTLQHFTLPLWVDDPLNPNADLDHWLSVATQDEFAEFAGDMAQEFGAEIDWWVTLNEPVVAPVAASQGVFPPDIGGSIATAIEMVRGEIFAHAHAYDAIHLRDTVDADGDTVAAKVGVAQHMTAFHPKDGASALDVAAAQRLSYGFNQLFLNAITSGNLDTTLDGDFTDAGEGNFPELANRLDWVGLNYYRKMLVVGGLPEPLLGVPQNDLDLPRNELGWSIYPEGMRETLDLADDYGLPIVITENGIADSDDDQRPGYLVDHLAWVARAIDEGVPVVGYMHWSLMDNFEWAEGFSARFGLYRMDYTTMERIPTESSDAYAEICAANALTADVQNRYRSVPE